MKIIFILFGTLLLFVISWIIQELSREIDS
jgi:hypothetical protein